jgi:autophagy-related protein 101
VLDRDYAREVLRGILHAIFFHRLFGSIKPKTFEVLDISFPGVADAEIERLVEEKVAAFWRAVDISAEKRGQVRPVQYDVFAV